VASRPDYDLRMIRDDTVAVVGAGVIGAAAAYALARKGRAVVLLDRAETGMAGARFGNAGHIASELVEPLRSVSRDTISPLSISGASKLPPRPSARSDRAQDRRSASRPSPSRP
jgi:glycine/D-amino acid oxidase-like deaminating enzyme